MSRLSSSTYEQIGRLVVRLGSRYVRRRYGRQLRVGAGVFAVTLGIAVAYLVTREVPEG